MTRPASQERLAEIAANLAAVRASIADACADAGLALRWHFVGQLQVNKVASVARYAHMVHSVDRARLVTALGRRASEAGRMIRCLAQVNLDTAVGHGDGP